MKTIAVLYGGKSSEHDVSCISAAAVVIHLARHGDFSLVPIGIDRDGTWYGQDAATVLSEAQTGRLAITVTPEERMGIFPGSGIHRISGETVPVDCVFPVLHGINGEDGTVQGALALAGIPYVGSTVVGSAIGMDKVSAKRIWHDLGLPIIPYTTIVRDEYIRDPERAFKKAADLGYPLFAKPNAAGSSVGISRVGSPEDLAKALELALEHDDLVLLEEALNVREIETAVLGNDNPRAFVPGEVIPSHEFYDYDAKYLDPHGASLEIPADISVAQQETVRTLCERAFVACRCRGLARVDCFLERTTGKFYLNEINTMPGFTPISMYPKLVEASGISYTDLLAELIRLAGEQTTGSNSHFRSL